MGEYWTEVFTIQTGSSQACTERHADAQNFPSVVPRHSTEKIYTRKTEMIRRNGISTEQPPLVISENELPPLILKTSVKRTRGFLMPIMKMMMINFIYV